VFRARRMMRRRAARAAAEPEQAQDQARPPEPEAVNPLEQIKELAELREQGILTEEEFAAEKKRLLGG
jgi:putative oligomerization/nucleic acid binding protein